jgi:hypothetical protein
MPKEKREIPMENSIGAYMHCGQCLQEYQEKAARNDPDVDGVSPADYQKVECGWTKIGFQVWCKRHDCNICHVDFEGQKHGVVGPAGTAVGEYLAGGVW